MSEYYSLKSMFMEKRKKLYGFIPLLGVVGA